MKKKVIATMAAAAMTLGLVACGSEPAAQAPAAEAPAAEAPAAEEPAKEEAPAPEAEAEAPAADTAAAGGDLNGDGKIIVGYISKNTVDVFHATLNGAAQERLDALVADGTIDEWTGILDGNTDAAKQCDLAQDCINYPCDYVIILPAEATASDPAVTAMAEAGIGVVVVNSATDSTETAALTFSGSDDVYAGELMGNYVMEQAPDGGVFVHCQGIIGNSAQIQRGEGIANTIEKDSKWTKAADVPCDWDASKAVNTVDDYLAQYGDDDTKC